MTRMYDDFDEFEFDDSFTVRKMLQEIRRDDLRRAIERKRSQVNHRNWDDYGDESDDYEDYEDYDEEEFDSHS